MKKLIICLALFVAALGYSQENDAHFDDAIKLMQMSNASVEEALEPLFALIPKDKKEGFTNELKPLLDNMYTKLAKVAIKEYTHDDIKAMIAFYQTDLGQTMLGGQVKIAQASMQISQELSMQLMPIYQKYMTGN